MKRQLDELESENALVFEAREALRKAIDAIDKMAVEIESTQDQASTFLRHARRMMTELAVMNAEYRNQIEQAKASSVQSKARAK